MIGRAALAVNSVVFGLSAWLAPLILSLFISDPQTADIAVHLTRVLAVGYIARAVAMVFESAQGGAGDTISPLVIDLIALWAVQVPVAIALSRWTRLGPDGIWAALVLSWVIQAALMAVRFRQGHWRRQRV